MKTDPRSQSPNAGAPLRIHAPTNDPATLAPVLTLDPSRRRAERALSAPTVPGDVVDLAALRAAAAPAPAPTAAAAPAMLSDALELAMRNADRGHVLAAMVAAGRSALACSPA